MIIDFNANLSRRFQYRALFSEKASYFDEQKLCMINLARLCIIVNFFISFLFLIQIQVRQTSSVAGRFQILETQVGRKADRIETPSLELSSKFEQQLTN